MAQVAAVRALEDEAYYAARYAETRSLRADLVLGLRALGIREIVPGVANFLLFHLGPDHPEATKVINACRGPGIFLRDVSRMGLDLGSRAIRTAVKDAHTNALILEVLGGALGSAVEESASVFVSQHTEVSS